MCFATRSLLNPLLPTDLTTLQKLPHENENISKLCNPMAQKLVAKPKGGKVLDTPKEETEEEDSKISRKRMSEVTVRSSASSRRSWCKRLGKH